MLCSTIIFYKIQVWSTTSKGSTFPFATFCKLLLPAAIFISLCKKGAKMNAQKHSIIFISLNMASKQPTPLAVAAIEWRDKHFLENDGVLKISLSEDISISSENGETYSFHFITKTEEMANENGTTKTKGVIKIRNPSKNIRKISIDLLLVTKFDQTTHVKFKLQCGPKELPPYSSNEGEQDYEFKVNLIEGRFVGPVDTVATLVVKIHHPLFSSLPTLAQDIQNLLMNDDLSDIQVVCQGQGFKCHKVLLGARSDVFKAMLFDGNFKEGQEGLLKIDDTPVKDFKALLNFIYTDTLESKDLTCDLLIAAHKYNVKRLIDVCLRHVMASITVETAIKTIYTADLMNNDELLKAAVEFMAQNRGSIKKCPLWDHFKANDPATFAKVMEKMFFETDENVANNV